MTSLHPLLCSAGLLLLAPGLLWACSESSSCPEGSVGLESEGHCVKLEDVATGLRCQAQAEPVTFGPIPFARPFPACPPDHQCLDTYCVARPPCDEADEGEACVLSREVSGVDVDATHVYWTEPGRVDSLGNYLFDGRVMRRPAGADGASEVLLTGRIKPRGLQVGDSHLTFVDDETLHYVARDKADLSRATDHAELYANEPVLFGKWMVWNDAGIVRCAPPGEPAFGVIGSLVLPLAPSCGEAISHRPVEVAEGRPFVFDPDLSELVLLDLTAHESRKLSIAAIAALPWEDGAVVVRADGLSLVPFDVGSSLRATEVRVAQAKGARLLRVHDGMVYWTAGGLTLRSSLRTPIEEGLHQVLLESAVDDLHIVGGFMVYRQAETAGLVPLP